MHMRIDGSVCFVSFLVACVDALFCWVILERCWLLIKLLVWWMGGSIPGSYGKYWIRNNCYFWKEYQLVSCSFSSSCQRIQSLILQMRNGRLKNLWKKIKISWIFFSRVETIHHSTQSWFATYLYVEFLSGWMGLFLFFENSFFSGELFEKSFWTC